MKNISLNSLLKPVAKVITRFHMTVFIVLIVAGLAGAVLFLNAMLTSSSTADGYTSPIDVGSIDQSTLERIRELHTSDNQPSDWPSQSVRRVARTSQKAYTKQYANARITLSRHPCHELADRNETGSCRCACY